jgi:hypothetical protein
MQIVLDILENEKYGFKDELRKKIDKVKDLNKYINVLPKNIQINAKDNYHKFTFIEKLFKIFDKSITSFNDINCILSDASSNALLLSNIAKKI